MKLATSILLIAATAASLAAQTPAAPAKKPPTAATAAKKPAVPLCVKQPELSPKIPALPLTCAKPLYTISSLPSLKLDYVSPLESTSLHEYLGIDPTSFTLAYIDIKTGTGPLAAPHKWYTIHYTGYLVDGTKFDSSLDRNDPIIIPYGDHKVIPGWDTGFDGMHIGGKRRLFIPWQLAYGPNGKGPIPPKAELIFDVELIAQSDTDPTPPPAPPVPPPAPAGAPPATPPPSSEPKQ